MMARFGLQNRGDDGVTDAFWKAQKILQKQEFDGRSDVGRQQQADHQFSANVGAQVSGFGQFEKLPHEQPGGDAAIEQGFKIGPQGTGVVAA